MKGRVTLHSLGGGLLSEKLNKAQHENMLEVMRQNVYIIELMKELFDKEPRYAPRRWYDHGWM